MKALGFKATYKKHSHQVISNYKDDAALTISNTVKIRKGIA